MRSGPFDGLHVRNVQLRPHCKEQIQHQDVSRANLQNPTSITDVPLSLDEEA